MTTLAVSPARVWLPLTLSLTLHALLALAVLLFYWVPLTDANTTLQWDAIDYHLSVQKYFGDEVHAGRLPLWTEYTFSGFPFLGDPQVGAWYPLNWPFFLFGVTPGALKWELAVHCLLACLGAELHSPAQGVLAVR